MKRLVSIQGFEGSFHQIAARQFFGDDVEINPCATFREVVAATKNGNTRASVMAIENSIAGSILANYNLLHNSDLSIVGEVYLPIRQHLLVNPGVALADIREVHSHPIAILQCMEFLSQHHWKLVETEDTALSARHIHQRKSIHIAGIAGDLAATLFELEKAAENIHTEKNNYTRFLILQKNKAELTDADKASLSFHTDHSRGSLARVLTTIAAGGINLSKLQSFPIPSDAWKYNFHADLEFDTKEQLNTVLNQLKPITQAVTLYGMYKNGNPNSF